jgi:hypothetical protein
MPRLHEDLLRIMRAYVALGGGSTTISHEKVKELATMVGIDQNQLPAVCDALAKNGQIDLKYGEIEVPLEKPSNETAGTTVFNMPHATFYGEVTQVAGNAYITKFVESASSRTIGADIGVAIERLKELASALPDSAAAEIQAVRADLEMAAHPATPHPEKKSLIRRAVEKLAPLKSVMQHGAEIATIADFLLKIAGVVS